MMSFINRSLLVFGIFFAFLCGLSISRMLRKSTPHTFPVEATTIDPVLIKGVKADSVLQSGRDFRTNNYSYYTLVEFGDYQCVPCGLAYTDVQKLLNAYPTQLRFEFRNLPLKMIHDYALESAYLAEAASRKGRFEEAQELLFACKGQIDPKILKSVAKKLSVSKEEMDSPEVISHVANDIELSQKLSVSQTPSFLLCDNQGTVYKIRSLSQVDAIMRRKNDSQ